MISAPHLQKLLERAFIEFEDEYLNTWGESWRKRGAPRGHVLHHVWKKLRKFAMEAESLPYPPNVTARLDPDAIVAFYPEDGRGIARISLTETAMERGTRIHQEIARAPITDADVNEFVDELANYQSPPDDMPGTLDWKGSPKAWLELYKLRASARPVTIATGLPHIPPEGLRGVLTKPNGSKVNGIVHADGRFIEDTPEPVVAEPASTPGSFVQMLDRCSPRIDGMTLGAIMIAWCDAQREVPDAIEKVKKFTTAQKDAARAEWSRQVARDVKASEEAERKDRELVVDDDRWDP